MPKPEQIDDREIELVYNQFKSELGNAVVKSLNEVVGFKNKIEEFQRTLVNQKAKELESQLKSIAEQIRVLDDEYSEKLKVIDKKGVLKNLKVSLKIYEAKKDSISHTKFLFDQYEKNEKKKRMLNLQKTQQLMEIDSEIEQNKEIMDDFVQVESQVLNKMFDFIVTNQLSPITHWNEISINKPVKGMTEDECLLAFGKPQTIQESNGEVQWMYSSSFYLFFKNGHVETIIK